MKLKKKLMVLSLCFALILSSFTACTTQNAKAETVSQSQTTASTVPTASTQDYNGKLVFDHSMELTYAKLFKVDYYKGGYKLITIIANDKTEQKVLTVPKDMKTPTEVTDDTIVLQLPLSNILVSSTPTISLINTIGMLDKVSLTTSDYDTWYIDDVKAAMDKKSLTYIGEYKAPDYEMLATAKPPFAIFSAMLSSAPDVAQKLKELKIPVIIDQATYEEEPLARVEWAKLYGALFDCEDKANAAFEEQVKYVKEIPTEKTGKKVAVFYITSKNILYARNGGDYMSKMVEQAGGEYIFSDMNATETGTEKMEFEAFYEGAKDADYIVYIWSVGGKPKTLEEFKAKNELFADFKAVKDGNVWCTTPDYFQISNTLGYMIKDMNSMMTQSAETDKLTYLFKLK